MNRIFLLAGSLAFLTFAQLGTAGTCVVSGPGWTFNTQGSGSPTCGSLSNGVQFTSPTNGQIITIFPEEVYNGTVQSNTSMDGNPVNGLFETQKGSGGNLASGIGPFDNYQGGSYYTGQQGIQDSVHNGNTTDIMLYIEIANNGTGAIPDGSTLNFLMQEGDVADYFNVYTATGNSSTPPNLTSMNQVNSHVPVGTLNGGATTPQFSITTATNATNHIEWIAIQADCTYLLLNQITETASAVPEPRLYGLLLAGLLGLVGIYARKRRPAVTQ
jgi:hypothetical protein